MNEFDKKIRLYLDNLHEEISAKNFPADCFARLVVIWTLISRIPLPKNWWPREIPQGNRTLSVAPAAGAAMGLLNGLFISLLLLLGMGKYPAAWLGVAFYSACGWTLHLDGWGDLCDGIGSGKSGEELRSVIKDSRLGACGAIGLILALGLWTSLVSTIPVGKIAGACVVAAATARLASCSAALFGHYPWDNGMAKDAVGKFVGYDFFCACLCALFALPFAPVQWLFSAIIAFLVGYGFAREINPRLGGVNGDVLGAAAVAAEIFSLAVFALC